MNVKVNIINNHVRLPQEVIEAVGGDELLARIFFNRGYKDPGTIRQMMDEAYYRPVSTDEFPNMAEAVKIISEAVDGNKTICIYGDFDVDGVTSTVALGECRNIL